MQVIKLPQSLIPIHISTATKVFAIEQLAEVDIGEIVVSRLMLLRIDPVNYKLVFH